MYDVVSVSGKFGIKANKWCFTFIRRKSYSTVIEFRNCRLRNKVKKTYNRLKFFPQEFSLRHELQFMSWKRDSSIVLKNGDNIFKDTAKHSHDQNFVLKYLL